MSNPVPISDGLYTIFSVPWNPQDADLINPGGPDGYIGGFHNNDLSKRMIWKLTNTNNNNAFTLTNQQVITYAQINSATNTLVGSNDAPPVEWAAFPTATEEQFNISSPDGELAWTLPDNTDGTAIALNPINATPDPNQAWQFVPFHA